MKPLIYLATGLIIASIGILVEGTRCPMFAAGMILMAMSMAEACEVKR